MKRVDALFQVCSCFPPDRRVCTCLSRAILSPSRSCLLALSCRSSFLICSTCQAESRYCHRYAPKQSDDNYYQTLCLTTETTAAPSDAKCLTIEDLMLFGPSISRSVSWLFLFFNILLLVVLMST